LTIEVTCRSGASKKAGMREAAPLPPFITAMFNIFY
jgi:hypothetical protein